ncbi:MAG: glycosyltransferase involved in cell wall biosynthesis [Spirosomataceae bacterium]|jgi:glycosyltransferase involved in cell wall biosynthesis
MKDIQISVVIPLYNEDESLPELHAWIKRVMDEHHYTYEVLFIDDGSKDNSWRVITELKELDSNVRGFRFARNYGKTAALQTGFNAAKGDVVITMDSDLQDSPDEIPGLYKMIKDEGFDMVSGWKKKRYDPLSKTLPTKLYNAVLRSLSGIELHDFNCGLKAYHSRVAKSLVIYGEMHRFIPYVAKWNGFTKIGERIVEHRPRKYGTTKFGLDRFINGFLDVMTISFVNKFGRRPMHLFGAFGVLSFFVGSLITFFLIAEKLYNIWKEVAYRNVTDNPLFFLALVAILIGVQLFVGGFIGELLVRNNIKQEDEYTIESEV